MMTPVARIMRAKTRDTQAFETRRDEIGVTLEQHFVGPGVGVTEHHETDLPRTMDKEEAAQDVQRAFAGGGNLGPNLAPELAREPVAYTDQASSRWRGAWE